ncbi:methyltransferase domain-containing protein [Purpureocillium lavendulum]|uniref:Methyltransferase domain-containing protein n=1 Tax=Purpureocillium lavendulum TaxID=1247861 RepID=A0AB34FTI8_9HYPO|nr:methyltransferase domain-containing protein [Purpureocillium lavendulum]
MDYEALNRANWDERAPVHAASQDYRVKEYISDAGFIGDVVRFDRPLLGDVTGLACVHLQCHIGTDTLSLARLGAASVTGLDFSGASVAEARKLAAATAGSGGERLRFVEASVYDAPTALPQGGFDLVFTGIGALCWLPSAARWAKVVRGLLRPGGRLFLREGHPVLWAVDETRSDDRGGLVLDYPYFERGGEPTLFDEPGTYVDAGGHEFRATRTAAFNHGIGEIVQALLDEGMRVTGLVEHQSVPWEAVPGQMTKNERGYALRIPSRWPGMKKVVSPPSNSSLRYSKNVNNELCFLSGVEVVGEDAGVAALADRRIGDEADALAGGDDGLALVGGEDVGRESEIGDAGVVMEAHAQDGIQDAEQLQVLGRSLGADDADALGLGDDVEVADPAAEGAELGLLAAQAHLGEKDLGIEVFLVGEGGGHPGSEVGAI